MRELVFFLGLCGLTVLAPWLPANRAVPVTMPFPGWQTVEALCGKPLRRLPLDDREFLFAGQFPGKMARFYDGSREIIARWVSEPTRRLHGADVCFRGLGYAITPDAPFTDDQGYRWAVFHARKGQEALKIRFRMFDAQGNQWQDVSAWYWAATLEKTSGPWWAITIAENVK